MGRLGNSPVGPGHSQLLTPMPQSLGRASNAADEATQAPCVSWEACAALLRAHFSPRGCWTCLRLHPRPWRQEERTLWAQMKCDLLFPCCHKTYF